MEVFRMKMSHGLSFVSVAAGLCLSGSAFAQNYSCQADLVARGGQIIVSNIGDGFTYGQACRNALNQCEQDLYSFRQQGLYPYARCVVENEPIYPGPRPGPVTPVPPPGPGPFPPRGNYFEVSCASNDYRVNYCYVGRDAYNVRLADRFSDSRCVFGHTYGLTGEYLWVDQGCRGVFGIYTRR
jgi:hypothetical protein